MNVNAGREEQDWIVEPSFIHVTEAVIPESHYNLALIEGSGSRWTFVTLENENPIQITKLEAYPRFSCLLPQLFHPCLYILR